MTILGYDFYGNNAYFSSPTSGVRGINYLELKNSIVDEVSIREKTDSTVDLTSTKEQWRLDSRLIADFVNQSLEGGNVQNSGIEILQFAIKRREVNELNPITLGHVDFNNNTTLEYTDLTQENKEYVYSIVPVGNTGLEGAPVETTIKSDFVGWWLVDKDTNDTLQFDKNMDSINTVSTQLNQGRTLLETMSRFPTIYYDPTAYHTFTLQAVFLPDEWSRSAYKYQDILNKFVLSHKPFLCKGSNGEIYVVDVSNPRKDIPQNTWDSYDYFSLSLDCVEIEDYKTFLTE